MTTVALPIYLDNHATTRVDPRVLEAMLPFFGDRFGNAASKTHSFGWAAEEAVDAARGHVAQLIGARSRKEIVFTSTGTEADNLAIKGVAHAYRERGDHIVTTAIEHKAILESCKRLAREGFRVTVLQPDGRGVVDPDAVRRAIEPKTILVSIMLTNNEVGSVQPLEEIGRITREREVLLHSDAVQGVGRVPFDVQAMHVDLASLSAHKIYGPKGVGALYVRSSGPRVKLIAELDGSGHENGLRAGTLNVPGIVGLGEATRILKDEWQGDTAHTSALRDRLRERLVRELDRVVVHGPDAPAPRHPGNLSASFVGVEGPDLMVALKEIALSSGSACTSASAEPSYVLKAMGVPDELARSALRFGIGRFNTEAEIDYAVGRVIEEVRRLRA